MFIFRVSHSHASLKFVYDIGSFKATTIDQRINRALNLCIKTTFTKSQSGTADASVAKWPRPASSRWRQFRSAFEATFFGTQTNGGCNLRPRGRLRLAESWHGGQIQSRAIYLFTVNFGPFPQMVNFSLKRYLDLDIFLMGHPWPLFRLFSVCSNKHYNSIFNKLMWKTSIQYTVLGYEPKTFKTWVLSHNHLTSSWSYQTFLGGNLDFPKIKKWKKLFLMSEPAQNIKTIALFLSKSKLKNC